MTKIVLALMTIFGCSSLCSAAFQQCAGDGPSQTSDSRGAQQDASKEKKPGSGGGVDTLTWAGTWKLNEGKSKLAPGTSKNKIVVYNFAADKAKVTVDGSDSDGNPTHIEWNGKLDGEDYPVTGDPTSDAWAYKKIDDHTLELIVKKDGKVTASGRIIIAPDGKSRRITLIGTNPQGSKSSAEAVYDKQ